ncbi:hypothetical protein ACSSNL_07455 [Thalassobius sp. S69A]|uniref:hypothetical protein n=1 Tax=unclassified Thalassovita TaxID=2619711 RepID=UPI003C7D25F9
MSQNQTASAQAGQIASAQAALDALNQAYAYYTPAPYVAAQKSEPVEYYEYAAAA